MELYSSNESYKLYQGNMLDMLEVIEPNSIDSIITDPPYGLTSITKRFGKENSTECQYGKDGSFARLSRGFMGKEWDGSGIEYNVDTWQKCYEVLKPGGYLLAFGGSRTFHRIACSIEDAGFEIRDTIMWLYGSGFPKSMDISKQIDKRPNRNYENLNLFGKKLKEQRELKGYSKNDIDKMMGTNTAYAWWEGRNYLGEFKIQLPDKENYKKLKEILELNDDMDFIFEEAEREVIGIKKSGCFNSQEKDRHTIGSSKSLEVDITIPSTDLAKQWQGWGTALKPSFEPIIVARKPFKGSLVDNVIKNGVGGINIDECRVEPTGEDIGRNNINAKNSPLNSKDGWNNNSMVGLDTTGRYEGRFPANTILTYDETDFEEVCGGFPNTKSVRSNRGGARNDGTTVYNKIPQNIKMNYECGFNDSGSASRYFYCAKASKKDRDEGLDEFEEKEVRVLNATNPELEQKDDVSARFITVKKNTHPTVKPTNLMQYLVRLVTPKGGTILDPFNGSGSTGKAVMYENKERNKNYKYIGIELTEEYLPIAKARIEYVCRLAEEEKNEERQLSIYDLQ